MALGPRSFTAKRQKELEALEDIIDERIENKDDESDVRIPLNALPSINYHLERIERMYLEAGWSNVAIVKNQCDNYFCGEACSCKYSELTR